MILVGLSRISRHKLINCKIHQMLIWYCRRMYHYCFFVILNDYNKHHPVIGIAKHNRSFWRWYSPFSTIEEEDRYKVTFNAAFTLAACGAFKNALRGFMNTHTAGCIHAGLAAQTQVATGRRFFFFCALTVY